MGICCPVIYYAFEGGKIKVRRNSAPAGKPSPTQMKEKEEKKRQDDMMKRGQPQPPPPQRVQSDRILLADPSLVYNTPDPKEVLQKKLETQDYNPFGRAGGGAPNPRQEQSVTVNAEGNYSGLVMSNRTPRSMQNNNTRDNPHQSTNRSNTFSLTKIHLLTFPWAQWGPIRCLKMHTVSRNSRRSIRSH
jgi:hypothetical protein